MKQYLFTNLLYKTAVVHFVVFSPLNSETYISKWTTDETESKLNN